MKLLALLLFMLAPVAWGSTPTPTLIPSPVVPSYYPGSNLTGFPNASTMHTSEYCFDAEANDAQGHRMGIMGTHLVKPVSGSLKLPFGCWVQNVVQGPTEIAFTEAVTPLPTPIAGLQMGCGTSRSVGGHYNDWLGINFICAVTGMNDLTSEAAGDLSDLGVNWWRYVGMNDYDAQFIVDPDSLPVSFTVTNGDLLTGRVRFVISWYLPSTAFKH